MAYPVTLAVEYPERLSRLTTFFRLFMLIPQVFVFAFVTIAAEVILILSWFAILFTGRYPEPFLNFITWWLRWYARLTGYSYLLTDKYPLLAAERKRVILSSLGLRLLDSFPG